MQFKVTHGFGLTPSCALVAAALAFSVACSGSVSSPSVGTTTDNGGNGGNGGSASSGGSGMLVNPVTGATCTAADLLPTRAPLRRLTATQYSNSLQDLVQDPSFPAQVLPAESATQSFYNNADSQTPTAPLIEDYYSGGVAAAASILKNRSTMVPCTTSDSACGQAFIASFGRRVFRRPLTSDETTRFVGFFNDQLQATNFNVALQLVTQALLNSPQFLYLPEFGQPSSDAVVALTPYELASRLAFLLTDSTPDSQLLDAAAHGLSSPADIQAQIARLLNTPRARGAVANFHRQWLELSRLDDSRVQKNASVFPQWSDAFKASMRQEVDQFVEATVFDGDGKLSTLLTGTHTWVDDNLAPIYGVKAPAGGGFVDLDPSQRAGLLTMASFLSSHAHQTQTSPVWRGVFVLENLLCFPPLVPPKGVNTAIVDTPTTTSTGRQREEAHASNPSCAGCHKSIDGVGLTFENFDAIGHYRTKEADSGNPVDPSGALQGTDVDGPVTDSIAMAKKLAQSTVVRQCATTEWFRYAFARSEMDQDACTIQSINQAFSASGGEIKALLTAIATSKAFQSRPAVVAN